MQTGQQLREMGLEGGSALRAVGGLGSCPKCQSMLYPTVD